MAQVLRLIWRLDYELNFAYLDRKGSVLQAVQSTTPNFWSKIAEGGHHSFTAEFRDAKKARTFSVEPQTINGLIEWTAGTDIGRVLQHDDFRTIDKIARQVQKLCEIRNVNRIGMRLLCTSRAGGATRYNHEHFLKFLSPRVSRLAAGKLGQIQDIAFVLEGASTDAVNYRISFGPLADKNLVSSLGKPLDEKELGVLRQADVFVDIDLYETNISFSENTLFRWAQTKIPRAIDFISEFAKLGDEGS